LKEISKRKKERYGGQSEVSVVGANHDSEFLK
jgi:hypothetical protein